MNEPKRKRGFWQRARHKYRLSLVDEHNLNEKWYIHLHILGVFSVLFLLFAIVLAVFSLLIIYTPIRNVLPGYSESLRRQLIVESARVDSIAADLQLQRQYLNVIKQITAGEVQTDTVPRLDSLQLITRERLLAEAKNEALVEFMARYEEKEQDHLQLFDVRQSQPVVSFFPPVHGVVMQPCVPEQQQYATLLRTAERENVTSVLAGTVIYVSHEIDDTYTMMLQHQGYISVYRRLGAALKQPGSRVRSGETIAIVGSEMLIEFELWHDGLCINPEEVIAF